MSRVSLIRLQHLYGKLDLLARVQGQWSHSREDDSEKTYLAGAYGVCGYPATEGSGDAGWLANLELRYALTQAWQVATFVDHGESRLNAYNGLQDPPCQKRSATGLVARWATQHWHVSVVSAWKVGNIAPQTDVDRSPRVLAQMVRYF